MELTTALATLVFATFFLAGLVKGVIGLGLPSIAIGLLAIVMTPAQAAAILLAPGLVTNVWQMLGPHLVPLLRRLWPLFLASFAGVWLGGGVLTGDNARPAAFGLGLALMLYGIVGLAGWKPSVPPRHERWWNVPIGLATGLITGATGVFVLPAGPYFQAIGLSRDELVQVLGLSFTVSTMALAAILFRGDALQGTVLGLSFAAIVPALLGMAAGQVVRRRVSERTFRLCFFVGLTLLGLQQAIRNAPGL